MQTQKAAKKKAQPQAPSFTGNQHLENSPLNLLSLRDHGRNQLKTILSQVSAQSKHVIWDSEMTGTLNYIVSGAWLKSEGVDRLTTLTPGPLQTTCDAIIYLTYPILEHMQIIAEQIKEFAHERVRRKSFYVYLLPRKTYLCERTLEELGVRGDILVLGELHIDFFPIDKDLLTCALPQTLTNCLMGDISHLYDIAASLAKCQAVFGRFPIVRAKGDWSCAIVDMMRTLMAEDTYAVDCKPEIAQCILIDRTVDMITPVLAPRTYEGLIDEVFGVKHAMVTVKTEILGKSAQARRGRSDTQTVVLNSSDNVFKQVRDVNFKYLGSILGNMATTIQKGYDARHDARSTKELNRYMQKFKLLYADHALVEQHIHLADYIAGQCTRKMGRRRLLEHEFAVLSGESTPSGETAEDYLEELIGKQQPIAEVLRFMILTSMCQGGISAKKYDLFKKDIIKTYGLKYLVLLSKLEDLKLITSYEYLKKLINLQENNFNFSNVRKNFQLVKDPEQMKDISDPQTLGIYDLNIVGGGYAPLSARLVEAATRPHGWSAINSELDQLPGKTYTGISQESKRDVEMRKNEMAHGMTSHKTVLVFFVGGVTYSEISALRMLENRGHTPWKFVVATTDIVNGNQVVTSFLDPHLSTAKKMRQ